MGSVMATESLRMSRTQSPRVVTILWAVAVSLMISNCAPKPNISDAPTELTFSVLNNDPRQYVGDAVTLTGEIYAQESLTASRDLQYDLWIGAAEAAHTFGPPRSRICVQLRSGKISPASVERGRRMSVTGRVSTKPSPMVAPFSCPSNIVIATDHAVPL